MSSQLSQFFFPLFRGYFSYPKLKREAWHINFNISLSVPYDLWLGHFFWDKKISSYPFSIWKARTVWRRPLTDNPLPPFLPGYGLRTGTGLKGLNASNSSLSDILPGQCEMKVQCGMNSLEWRGRSVVLTLASIMMSGDSQNMHYCLWDFNWKEKLLTSFNLKQCVFTSVCGEIICQGREAGCHKSWFSNWTILH